MRLDRGLLLLTGDLDPAARGGVVSPAVGVAIVHREVLDALVRLHLSCKRRRPRHNKSITKKRPQNTNSTNKQRSPENKRHKRLQKQKKEEMGTKPEKSSGKRSLYNTAMD